MNKDHKKECVKKTIIRNTKFLMLEEMFGAEIFTRCDFIVSTNFFTIICEVVVFSNGNILCDHIAVTWLSLSSEDFKTINSVKLAEFEILK